MLEIFDAAKNATLFSDNEGHSSARRAAAGVGVGVGSDDEQRRLMNTSGSSATNLAAESMPVIALQGSSVPSAVEVAFVACCLFLIVFACFCLFCCLFF